MKHYDISKLNQQELLNQYEEMKEIASRDSLTGLLNRGAMEREINLRLQRMGDTDCCAMFIVDLDDFKAVNDNYGHQSGDNVLIKTARLLSKMFRATDIVGRLGGDEFVIFLSGRITESLIRTKGQMICDQIQFIVGIDPKVIVTASVGIYVADGRNTFEYIYQSADLALYRAKKGGKQSYCLNKGVDGRDLSSKDQYTSVNAVRLRTLLDNMDSGVAMIEALTPMKFLYVSTAFARMLGMEVGQLSEKEALSFIHPDERKDFERNLRHYVMEKNETFNQVVRIIDANGCVFWWKIHASSIEYNDIQSVIFITVVDVSDLKEKESELQMDRHLLLEAADQAAQGIWEVEWNAGTFRIIGENQSFPEELSENQNFPKDLIEKGWIHPDCADDFNHFAEEIFVGRLQGYANFKIKFRQTGEYGWASFSYRTVCDEKGIPVRIVGLIEGMVQDSIGQNHSKNVALPNDLTKSLILQMCGNLTEDTVEMYWSDGQNQTDEGIVQSCTGIFDKEIRKIVSKESKRHLSNILSRDALMIQFLERGQRWFYYEYTKNDGKKVRMSVSCVINLYQQSDVNQDVHIAMWISRLNQRDQWEAAFDEEICRNIHEEIHKESLSRIYLQSTAKQMTVHLLKKGEKHKTCALVLIEIGGMARLYAQYSEKTHHRVRAVLTALLLAVGTDCIPCRFTTDRYLFFFPEIENEGALKRKLEQVFVFVRNITSDIVEGSLMRFFATGVCRPYSDADYEDMLKKAEALSPLANCISGDRVIFEGEELEQSSHLQKSVDTDKVHIFSGEALRPLSDRERDTAFTCILEMLNTDSLEESASCMLRFLGEYYEADRTYILTLMEKGHIISMPQEWTATHKHSIQQAVSGMVIDKFPLLERCIKEDKPIVLTRNCCNHSDMSVFKMEESWRFAVFPMRDSGKSQAYLCIENAKNYISDDTLPSLLSSCLLKERKKYLRHFGFQSLKESVLQGDLPNYSVYIKDIVKYTSDTYHCLGVVCIDIPEISYINSRDGFEHGRKMIWFIIQMLTDIFGPAGLYRTWDAEFAVLCPDMIQQVFYGKCARLRAALTRHYPKKMRMGYTWSDKAFTGKALADEAKVIMSSGRLTFEKEKNLPGALAFYNSVGEMISAGKFTVYFQPEIDMKTGEIVGAEALVRAIDEDGKLIDPARFIKALEQDKSIRDLDLFVYDYVLKTLNEWIEEGYKAVPVSVNFSKETLLDAHISASVLAIQSRYSHILSEWVFVEVKADCAGPEAKMMEAAMNKLQEYRVKFTKDHYEGANDEINVPFDAVKVNRSLFKDILSDSKQETLMTNMMSTLNTEKIFSIVQGIESKEQADALQKAGCRYAQGYYYDYPLSKNAFFNRYIKDLEEHVLPQLREVLP